jgi:hypothetical protein
MKLWGAEERERESESERARERGERDLDESALAFTRVMNAALVGVILEGKLSVSELHLFVRCITGYAYVCVLCVCLCMKTHAKRQRQPQAQAQVQAKMHTCMYTLRVSHKCMTKST